MISPWVTFELLLRGRDGALASDGERPFSSDLLVSGGDPLTTALQKMRLVEVHGWPDAKLSLRDKRGKGLIDRADDEKDQEIYILKCKPSCWRLYFCIYTEHHRIVYLYAVCKQKQRRNKADSVRARNRHRRIGNGPGRAGIAEFVFPT
jgi:hypothetical protein